VHSSAHKPFEVFQTEVVEEELFLESFLKLFAKLSVTFATKIIKLKSIFIRNN
jgi:hypothetical protein